MKIKTVDLVNAYNSLPNAFKWLEENDTPFISYALINSSFHLGKENEPIPSKDFYISTSTLQFMVNCEDRVNPYWELITKIEIDG